MKHRRSWVFGWAVVLGSSGWAQVTQRVSVASNGTQADGECAYPSISADGRYLGFRCAATNLVSGDTNGFTDAYFRDWQGNATQILSVDSSEVPADDTSDLPSVSANGRYLAFTSYARNLVAGDTNSTSDIFVRDRTAGTTVRVSVSSSGVQANNPSWYGSISADARYVVFASLASNLVLGDTNGAADVFVRDLLSGVTERVSVDTAEAQASGSSNDPSISADGRYVAFVSAATDLVSGDTNGDQDVFVRDRLLGVTVRASVNNMQTQGNGKSDRPAISADGHFVAFESEATNLIGPFAFDTNGVEDVFVRDLVNGGTGRVSLTASQAQANAASESAAISGDGRFVAFSSTANLVPGDTNGDRDIFVRDRSTGTTARVSVSSSGVQANSDSESPAISADGRFVAFHSWATNLVLGDSNDYADVFVHDRDAAGFRSQCEPGVSGVIACPCSNPPTLSGRGCNNSAGTGGAVLQASGAAYLSMDSLVFTTLGEKPTALSIVLQGTARIPAGSVFGQGVRCVGGTLKRLFTKSASLGSITAPDFAAGDPSVSARSAAKGDTIQAGQSRWYLVYYRDTNVLGGCPAVSNFNTTQTGKVTWGM